MSLLPTELLFHVIECLIPSDPPVAFPASHVVTRTFLKLCLVSKSIHYAATRCLFAHCVYIDSPDRLRLLQQTLIDHRLERAFGVSIGQRSPVDPECANSNLDARLRSPPTSLIRSVFLAPFPTNTIDSPEIARLILSLCTTLGPQLTRLVIDIPLRSLYPEDDTHHVRPLLHAAFTELVALDEFVSTRDELFLDVIRRDWDHPSVAVWSTWPNLKRLALYNVDVSASRFIRDIQQCRNLTHLVLTRSDGLNEKIDSLYSAAGPHLTWQRSRHLQRVSLVNTAGDHRFSPAFSRRGWEHCFVGKLWNAVPGETLQRVHLVKINVPDDPVGRIDGNIELCQEWVRDTAIHGILWDWADAELMVKSDPEELGRFKFAWVPPDWSSPDFPSHLENNTHHFDSDPD